MTNDHVVCSLSAQSMLDATPFHEGQCLKLHLPLFFVVCPPFIKRQIFRLSAITRLLQIKPTWKQRHLILLGKYLYKFQDITSSKPKGCPISLESMISIVSVDEYDEDTVDGIHILFNYLPPGFKFIIAVSTLYKTQYFALSSSEESVTWINSLREAKQESITRAMGHSRVPIPSSWEFIDNMADDLCKRKESIKARLNSTENRNMDMSMFEAGGPASRGIMG
mmetsp:Transcript_1708/g.1817  ORF Transcript_1708/g.1817 Transcript_1708/m.1817 type:complete len:223 (-) Transcript_1708:275-943(-)|eukprot:CAMPEP_0194372878 /NCGR_PEP_ID=MMETSP0174-20130528/21278_1 /TAXON_ID=216777 /ORGANISM="Proboscia alata, Strain PI-D3" /LENGTH=222 /DNA_ID=CAMNT_0039151633 /DNA_START=256 /DNA_END=924 /DNA_ORIENTATION=-